MSSTEDLRARINQKMKELQIEGFSSMGQFSDHDRLTHLEEIERIVAGRRRQCADQTCGEPGIQQATPTAT